MASYCEADATYVLDEGDYIVRIGNSSRDTKIASAHIKFFTPDSPFFIFYLNIPVRNMGGLAVAHIMTVNF